MARKRRSKGKRKSLREARALTFISAAFVATGGWSLSNGVSALGLAAVVFFSAGVLFGIMLWYDEVRSRRTEGSAGDDSRWATVSVVGIAVASALLGLGCLAVVVFGIIGWSELGTATTMLFPRVLVLVAAAVGTVFFLGGAVYLLVRAFR